jgi:hypothetical protein
MSGEGGWNVIRTLSGPKIRTMTKIRRCDPLARQASELMVGVHERCHHRLAPIDPLEFRGRLPWVLLQFSTPKVYAYCLDFTSHFYATQNI